MTLKEKNRKKKLEQESDCYVDILGDLNCHIINSDENTITIKWNCSECNHSWEIKLPKGSRTIPRPICEKCTKNRLGGLKYL